MSFPYTFKRGDLLGVNTNGDHMEKYLIAQVIRENRLFYCLCLETQCFHFIVFDPTFHFLLCPGFDLAIRPDIDVMVLSVEFYNALDRLFGYDGEPSE